MMQLIEHGVQEEQLGPDRPNLPQALDDRLHISHERYPISKSFVPVVRAKPLPEPSQRPGPVGIHGEIYALGDRKR